MPTTHRGSPLALTVLALLHYKPLHPYGLQRLIRQWGKDEVVNVGQRASLYRTIERLHQDGLVAVRETSRDQVYPERTVYEITGAGREVAREWLEDMLSTPKREFPQFPAALSHLLMLAKPQIVDALNRRLGSLSEDLARLDASLAAEKDHALPRIAMLETEYLHAMTSAEISWLRSVIDDLRTDRLTWSPHELVSLSEGQEGGAQH